ncbi:hypothetical protein [Colwellia sp. 20A7]|uniref:hypothetical protein n=1 Tax=Colwellia sp. 20A7 TaxID=2689569 RepID=UPI0013579A90|nr:hypothetical protein [Colwellia sp. 20A7]
MKLSNQVQPLEAWIDARATEGIPFIVLGDFNRRFNRDIELGYSEYAGLWQAIDDEGAEDMWAPTTTAESKYWGGITKTLFTTLYLILEPNSIMLMIHFASLSLTRSIAAR